jgi:hypothetical protein
MRSRLTVFLLAFAFFVSRSAAQPGSISLGVEVYGLEKDLGQLLQAATARLDIQGVPARVLEFDPVNHQLIARLERSRACNTGSVEILRLAVGAPGDLLDRTIPLYATLICKSGRYTYKIHLAKREDRVFNTKYVLQARPMLTSGDPDAALAYLSLAMDDFQRNTPAEASDYSCVLKHYYAEALNQTCVTDSYATCDAANRLYQELHQWPRCQTLLKTRPQYYLQAEANVMAKEAQVALAENDLKAAVDRWADVGKIAENVDLKPIGLSLDLINTYSGLTFLKLAVQQESESPSDAPQTYKSAMRSFSSIKNPAPVVKGSQMILEVKLANEPKKDQSQ